MSPGAALRRDWRTFTSRWLSDWRDGLNPKTAASTAFLFFACLAPAVAFGGVMADLTGGQIGAVEMIVATAACGVAYALFSGQPLTVLGGTGPLLIFTSVLYQLCVDLKLPFLTAYAWVGLWTALFSVLLSVFGAARFIRLFTRFTDETFAALISLIFIVQALADLLANFPDETVKHDAALFAVLLALGTVTVAMTLRELRLSSYLRELPRQFLADFGPAIAVVSMVFARRLLMDVDVNTLAVPLEFATTSGRPWLVRLLDGPGWLPFAAALPAVLVTVLLYMDQNITTRLVNSPEYRLTKGEAYDLDFLVVGVLVAVCSVFGLPWLVAATVRSLNHVKSLTTTRLDAAGVAQVVSTRENRLSALLIHVLIGASLLFTGLLREVPMAVLLGLFLFMGVASMSGNQNLRAPAAVGARPQALPREALPAGGAREAGAPLHPGAGAVRGGPVGGEGQPGGHPLPPGARGPGGGAQTARSLVRAGAPRGARQRRTAQRRRRPPGGVARLAQS